MNILPFTQTARKLNEHLNPTFDGHLEEKDHSYHGQTTILDVKRKNGDLIIRMSANDKTLVYQTTGDSLELTNVYLGPYGDLNETVIKRLADKVMGGDQ
jgi:hypothetical protein